MQESKTTYNDYFLKTVGDAIYIVLNEKYEFIKGVHLNSYVDDNNMSNLILCVETNDDKFSEKLDNLPLVDTSDYFEDVQDYWYHLSMREDIMITIVQSMKYITNQKAHEYGIRFV